MPETAKQNLKERIFKFLKLYSDVVTTSQLMNEEGIGSEGSEAVQVALRELVNEGRIWSTVTGYYVPEETSRKTTHGADKGMRDLKRLPLMFLVGSLVGLYTTFVLEQLWNWFATDALHLPMISFWVMYGLVLLLGMFKDNFNNVDQDISFKSFGILLDACVPNHLRESVSEQLEELNEGIWGGIFPKVLGKILGNTFALLLGWIVHTFLV